MTNHDVLNKLIDSPIVMLANFSKVTGKAICAGATKDIRDLPAHYVLWWTKNPPLLEQKIKALPESDTSFINPNYHFFKKQNAVPLFAGQAANLSGLISTHMRLGIEGRLTDKGPEKVQKQPLLRTGLEMLFPDDQDPKRLIYDHVGMTYVPANDGEAVEQKQQFAEFAKERLKPVFVNAPLY